MLSEADREALMGGLESTEANVVQSTLTHGSYEDADGYAQDKRLADEAGIDISVVRHDRDEVKRQVGLSKIDIQNLMGESPELTNWLKNQDNANVAYDDIPVLAEVERTNRSRPWLDISMGDFEGLGDSMIIGMGKVYDSFMVGMLSDFEMHNKMTEDYIKLQRELGTPEGEARANEAQEKYTTDLANREQKIKKHIESLGVAEDIVSDMTPDDLTILGKGVRGGVQMIAEMAPGLVVTAGTRGKINLTLPLLTGKTYFESYATARVEGKEHDEAQLFAGTDAILEFITEKIPTKLAEDLFKGMDGGIKETVGKLMVGDIAGEQVATFTQSMNAVMHDLDKELLNAKSFEEAFNIQAERQIVTAISTLIGSGGISTVGATGNRLAGNSRVRDRALLKNIEKKQKSEAAQQWLDGQIFMAQSSKTNERSSESFAAYLEQLDPETRVFMDATIASKLENIPDYIKEQLDGTGADVSIPLAKFLTDFATNEALLSTVRPHIKVESDFMTQTEAKGLGDSAQVKTLLDKANEEATARTEADIIFDQIKDQLIGTGRQGQQTSRLSAELIPAYIVTKQKELRSRGIDVSVKELYDDMKLSVVGPKADPVVTPDVQVLEQANDLGMVVGFRTPDGKILAGKIGQMHFDLLDRFGVDETRGSEDGFVDEAGNFLTRKEAFKLISEEGPIIGGDAEHGLQSEDLPAVRQKRREEAGILAQDIIPTISPTQKFGDLTLTDTGTDDAGNTVIVEEKAQAVWNHHQKRAKVVENLRACINA